MKHLLSPLPCSLPSWPLLAVLLLAQPARADDDGADWRRACPGAAAWTDANAQQSVGAMKARDGARQLTRPELLAELVQRTDADQAARREYIASRFAPAQGRAAQRVDQENFSWLLKLAKANGLPTAAQVGEYGLHLTWLLVHHADRRPDFQQLALEDFKRRNAAGEFGSVDLARLSDRVAVNQGGRDAQPYGTQYDWGKGGVPTQHIPNLARIDANRQALGLMALADYGCMMHELRKPE